MKVKAEISEKVAQEIWKNQYIRCENLRLTNGYPITIVNKGTFNENEGADFLDAEFIYDEEKVAHGDVEIHLTARDWISHEHHKNPVYNNVILHVVMWDEGYLPEIRKENGKFLPTLILSDFLDKPIGKLMQSIRKEKKSEIEGKYPCQKNFVAVNLERLEKAGQKRFLNKVENFQEIASSRGWEQALYEGIMSAFGYSKNKWQFAELAQKLPIAQLQNFENDKTRIQAALFGMAGLLPSQNQRKVSEDPQTQIYVRELEACWKELAPEIEAFPMDDRQWIFSGQRPPNFPTVRIGQAATLLHKLFPKGFWDTFLPIFENLLDEKKPRIKLYKKLSDFIIADPEDFWARHYTFWGKSHKPTKNLLGKRRLKAIVLNILFPIFYAYSRMNDRKDLRDLIWQMYNEQPSLGENRITKYQQQVLGIEKKLLKSACLEQGLIYVYQNYCFQKFCMGCTLGQRL